MEELIIQKHWECTASKVEANNSADVRAEKYKKEHILTSVIVIFLMSFALLFLGYCFRKVYAYLDPQYRLEWQCQIPQIPASMPVYEVTPFSSKDYLEQNLELADRIGAEYNHICCTDKRGIYIDSDRENGVHLLVQNHSNGEYRYRTRKGLWTGWKSADRIELEEILSVYSIEIPPNAQFRVDGNGWHTFTVEPYFTAENMVAGEIRCRCADNGSVIALDHKLQEYTISEVLPVSNAKNVRNELQSGKYFRYMGLDNRESIRILSARITYAQSVNGSYVPYCCFQIQQGTDPEWKETMIPLLQEG